MKYDLNQNIINVINEKINDNDKTSAILMDILPLGKDAIYRRLRGEVPFTFEEAAAIAAKLNISLDALVSADNEKTILCELKILHSSSAIDDYNYGLIKYIDVFEKMSEDPNAKIMVAYNTLPYKMYLNYPTIARFRIYRWLYQRSAINVPFDLFKIPKETLELQKKFSRASNHAGSAEMIISRYAFHAFVNDILYFYHLNLIGKDEMAILKQELLEIVNDIDYITRNGKSVANGKDFILYISDVSIDSCYVLFESKSYSFSSIRLFAINSIQSSDAKMNKETKEWITSLKRYSTLITHASEKLRVDFVQQQREIVLNLFS